MSGRQATWYISWTLTFIAILTSITVLHRAYLALRCQRWVAIVGTILILPQLGTSVITMLYSYTYMGDHYGCTTTYGHTLAVYWLAAIMPINVLFSAIFCYVAYAQYRRSTLEAWRRLARDGIQVMCLVILCNIVCNALTVSQRFGEFSEMFFVFDG